MRKFLLGLLLVVLYTSTYGQNIMFFRHIALRAYDTSPEFSGDAIIAWATTEATSATDTVEYYITNDGVEALTISGLTQNDSGFFFFINELPLVIAYGETDTVRFFNTPDTVAGTYVDIAYFTTNDPDYPSGRSLPIARTVTQPTGVPDPPANLVVGADSITISWDANTEQDLAGYYMEVSLDTGTTFTRVGSQTGITFLYPARSPGVYYQWRVFAYDLVGGVSDPSDTVWARWIPPYNTYRYISNINGSDDNTGTHPDSAWATLTKLDSSMDAAPTAAVRYAIEFGSYLDDFGSTTWTLDRDSIKVTSYGIPGDTVAIPIGSQDAVSPFYDILYFFDNLPVIGDTTDGSRGPVVRVYGDHVVMENVRMQPSGDIDSDVYIVFGAYDTLRNSRLMGKYDESNHRRDSYGAVFAEVSDYAYITRSEINGFGQVTLHYTLQKIE